MHKNHFAHARKFLSGLAAALGLFLFTGCESMITRLTPATLPENPSQIYTISARIKEEGGNAVEGSIVPHVIVDGQDLLMKKSPLGQDIYDLDYQLPAGRDSFTYYILVNYKVIYNNVTSEREAYTQPATVKILNRYTVSLEASRGPVGAQIGVFGRGFTPQDIVYLDTTPARTVYAAPTSLDFFVPAVDTDRNYKVSINGASGSTPVGTFHVDPLDLQVSPPALSLRPGEQQPLTFTIPVEAPAGGMLLDVTTDVPESVIMPEVIVPAGSTSVTVTVQGGRPGSGSLVLKGYGSSSQVTIPITVR
ncbi:MAG: cell surface protein [Verrucomicrobiota bacterium]|nr:cell surface protein [Verrucomicrobiota bacterium]